MCARLRCRAGIFSSISFRPRRRKSSRNLFLRTPEISAANRRRKSTLRDQPRTALIGEIAPQPRDRDHEAVADADQKINVRDTPEQPADEAGELDPVEFHHRG